MPTKNECSWDVAKTLFESRFLPILKSSWEIFQLVLILLWEHLKLKEAFLIANGSQPDAIQDDRYWIIRASFLPDDPTDHDSWAK